MNEVCKFFNIIPESDVDSFQDGFLVERCWTVEQSLKAAVVCYYANIPALKDWLREHVIRVGDYVCGEIDGGRGTHAMKVLTASLKIPSFTHEFVVDCGGEQQFLDRYCQSSSAIAFTDSKNSEGTKGMESDTVQVKEESTKEPSDQQITSSNTDETVNEDEPSDIFMPDSEVAEADLDHDDIVENHDLTPSTAEDEDLPAEVVPEKEVPVEEDSLPVERSSSSVDQAAQSADLTELLKSGVQVPLSNLVECANLINAAANKLETSEIADTYILLKEDLGFAVNYVDNYSPSVIKSFMKSYVKSASSDVELIRVTKMLDAFAKYVMEKCDTGRKVVGEFNE